MRAVMLSPPPELLAERRRLGLDGRDEVWDGVLHMPPSPGSVHQIFESDLESVLRPIAKVRGLFVLHELNLLDPKTTDFSNFRVPDIVVVDPRSLVKQGIRGRVELVVEILSPDDESRDKLEFYAMCEVQEIWIVDPETRAIEVYVLRGNTYFAVTPDRAGIVHAPVLAIDLAIIDGPNLRLTWDGGTEHI